MKLYAKAQSERASVGQGGNKFLEIILIQEINGEREQVGKVLMEEGKIHFLYNQISDDVTVTLNGESIKRKGERQKGECTFLTSCRKCKQRLEGKKENPMDEIQCGDCGEVQ